MLLHLLINEKVTRRTIYLFESVFPNKNYFVCTREGLCGSIQEGDPVVYFVNGNLTKDIDFARINAVLIHYLTSESISFVEKYIPVNVPVYWFMWGGDFYPLLGDRGYDIYSQPIFAGRRYLFKSYILSKINWLSSNTKRTISFIRNRVSHCVTSREQLALCKKYYPNVFNDKKLIEGFTYYCLETVLKDLKDCRVSGNNILVGNSSSVSNNHNYAFNFLKRLDLCGRQIVAPLNYNGTERYRNNVISMGRRYFGVNFKPLLNFLPLEDYNKVLLSSTISVFASWRQEAWGNIQILLYMGSKVYMSEKSPLYQTLKRLGFVIFALESINDGDFGRTMLEADIMTNRRLLERHYSLSSQIKFINRTFGVYI